jgi:S1-C subfamily serine protease
MLKRSLSAFLYHEKTQPYLKSKTEERQSKVEAWDMLQLTDTPRTSTIQDVVKAGVTVKKGKSHGSGFLVSSEGHIITNYHVTGSEDELTVIFNNGNKYTAQLVRTNPRYDLSLLKIDAELPAFKPLRMSATIPNIGDKVFAIGTPLDQDLGQTLTQGIVSGKRTVENVDYYQFDTKINPGNSGGPLINENGELVGSIFD